MRKKVPRKIEITCVGMQHRVTMSTRRMLRAHVEEAPLTVSLVRERDNFMDKNAIMVVVADKDSPYDGMHVGYVPRGIAAEWARKIDRKEILITSAMLLSVDPDDGEGELHIKLKTPG